MSADQPNTCHQCSRQNVTLFDNLCGRCAFGVSTRKADTLSDYLVQAELETLRAEVARLTRALRNAHQANAELYDYTGGTRAA